MSKELLPDFDITYVDKSDPIVGGTSLYPNDSKQWLAVIDFCRNENLLERHEIHILELVEAHQMPLGIAAALMGIPLQTARRYLY
jgi:hypothetical protein